MIRQLTAAIVLAVPLVLIVASCTADESTPETKAATARAPVSGKATPPAPQKQVPAPPQVGSPTEPPTSLLDPSSYQRPPWMDKVVAQQQQLSREVFQCAKAKGAEVGIQDGIVGSFGYEDDPARTRVNDEIVAECRKQAQGEVTRDAAFWSEQYGRAVEMADCLAAYGYRPADPPPEETWVAAMLKGKLIWNPMTTAEDTTSIVGWPGDTTCPVSALMDTWH